jgi:hypothetical protein
MTQTTEQLLNQASRVLSSLQKTRKQAAEEAATPEAEDWWVDIFGDKAQRQAVFAAEIAKGVATLESIRAALIDSGLTHSDCKALWQQMQTSKAI